MSFLTTAAELIDRTEAQLDSLIADALRAKAYREIGPIAAMAEAVSQIASGRSREGRKIAGSEVGVGAGIAESPKSAEPTWLRSKT